MGKKLDLTNQKFGKLIVIKDSNKRDSSGCVIWECQCDCGNVTYASSGALRSGHKQSCGCKNIEQVRALGLSNLIDLTGQKFGKLTVLERDYTIKKDNRVFWKCQCDCGNIYIANGHSLKNGSLQSCGCIKSNGEAMIQKILTENNIEFIKEKTFEDLFNSETKKPFRFDFYLPQYNRLIEFDGKQHFEEITSGSWANGTTLQERQQKDKIKNQYAIQNNIDLIRIPYWEKDNLNLELLLGNKYMIKEEKE